MRKSKYLPFQKNDSSKVNVLERFGKKFRKVFLKEKKTLYTHPNTRLPDNKSGVCAPLDNVPEAATDSPPSIAAPAADIDVNESGVRRQSCGGGDADASLANGAYSPGVIQSTTPASDPVAHVFRQKLLRQDKGAIADTQSLQSPNSTELTSSPESSNGFSSTLQSPSTAASTSISPSFKFYDNQVTPLRNTAISSWQSRHKRHSSDDDKASLALESPRLWNGSLQKEEQKTQVNISDRHQTASRDAWQVYAEWIKTEEDQNAWITFFAWLQLLHEAEAAELRTEVFTAECTIKAREVEIANDHDDYEAELKDLEEQRDEAQSEIVKLKAKLMQSEQRKREIQRQVKNVEKDNEELKKDVKNWQQRTEEAVALGDEVKSQLDTVQAEHGLRTQGEESADTIRLQQAQIDRLQTETRNLVQENKRLREPLEYAKVLLSQQHEEIQSLKKEVKHAAIEAGAAIRINIAYCAAFEDQPGKVAHLDGHLKRMDEAYQDLLRQFNECREQRAEQEKLRDVDREHFNGVRLELKQDIIYKKHEIEGLEESRDRYKQHNEEILDMLSKRAFHKDVAKVMNEEHELLKEDNDFLIKMVRAGEVNVQETIAKIAPLHVKIVELERAVENSAPHLRHLQAEVNGLQLRNSVLDLAASIPMGELQEKIAELEAQLQAEKQRFEETINNATGDEVIQNFIASKTQEINSLRSQVQSVTSQMCYWHNRALESCEPISYMEDFDRIWDFNAEGARLRLNHAERGFEEMKERLRERRILGEVLAEMDPRFDELGGFTTLTERAVRYIRDV